MREEGDEDVHAVLDSLEAAGKVDDEGSCSQAGLGPGQTGGGDALVQTVEADGFTDARRAAVDDGQGCLGGDVAGGEARAARGDDGVHMAFRGPLLQDSGNFGLLVGDDRRFLDGPAGICETLYNSGPALVDAVPGGTTVADGQNCCSHGVSPLLITVMMSPALIVPDVMMQVKMPSRGMTQSPTSLRISQPRWHSLPIWVTSIVTAAPIWRRVPIGRVSRSRPCVVIFSAKSPGCSTRPWPCILSILSCARRLS